MVHAIWRFIRRNILVKIKPSQTILIGFAVLILFGAALLALPAASRSGKSIGFVGALFTATSATCVTGLVVVDTCAHWTTFGKAVILFLIQVGGLGFMTIATMLSLFLRRTITLRERLLMAESLNRDSMQGIVRLVRHILFGTFFFEGVGAVILAARFIPEFGVWGGFSKGVFHAVSAFCNAGFDLMGDRAQFSSLTAYSGDWIVNVTVMFLIVVGGLGFVVWEDMFQNRSWKKFHLHTKVVLVMTVVLIAVGFLSMLALEWSNPLTLANASPSQKVLIPLFQSVTARTAGFQTIAMTDMRAASLLVMMILMFIGGSPGSTAGGVKTATIGVLVLACCAMIRGRQDINVFGRRLKPGVLMKVLVLLIFGITVALAGTMTLLILENRGLLETMFEVVSAIGTVGLTMDMTPTLSQPSQLVLVVIMYLGRVGVMTTAFALSVRKPEASLIRYPEGNIMVG